MPININSNYLSFVAFAKEKMHAGEGTAIARDLGESTNEAAGISWRTIKAATGDRIGPIWRRGANQEANDATRGIFRQAVYDIFGGEAQVPESVRTAMLMKDYGKGKPLTARRIAAVNDAVLAEVAKLEGAKRAALENGLTRSEVDRMSEVAELCAKAAGVPLLRAFQEVSKPGSRANRLMNYGGRFLDSPRNFGRGLRLLGKFKEWFSGLSAQVSAFGVFGIRDEGVTGSTLLNAQSANLGADSLRGFEKFTFEHLALDTSIDLEETDPENVFGFEHNPACRFLGLGLNNSCTQTIAQIPPRERATLYRAMELFYPLARDANEANMRPDKRGTIPSSDCALVIARIIKNFDAVRQMIEADELTEARLFRLCFPELTQERDPTLADVARFIRNLNTRLENDMMSGKFPQDLIGTVDEMLKQTGCSYEVVLNATKHGIPLPRLPYVSSGTLGLAAFDGKTTKAREQLARDLIRAYTYSDMNSKESYLAVDDVKFTFNFSSGGEPVSIYPSEEVRQVPPDVKSVMDRIEDLCGRAHPAQASSVMMMVSQSGLSLLRGGLSTYGIYSTEHSACDFTLAKDPGTGDVTILYRSPKALKFSFHWSVKVRTDGFVTTMPFSFTEAPAEA